jgi:ribosomal protein L3
MGVDAPRGVASSAGMTRVAPHPGMAAEVQYLGASVPATVVEVDGARVTAVDATGERLTFEINALTAQFVLAGEPYYGPRLRLRPDV